MKLLYISVLRGVAPLLSILSLLLSGLCYANQVQKQPNIIFILADDLGYGDVGYLNKESKIPTPHIDQIAKQGMSFLNAYTSSTVCTPTRYGIMTGRYAWRSRLKDEVLYNFDYPLIEKDRLTVAAMLKNNGYNTALIGKWHLGLEWVRKDGQRAPWSRQTLKENNVDFSQKVHIGINDFGFDYSFGINASADMLPYVFIENGKTLGIPSVPKPAEGYGRPGLMVEGWKTEDLMPTFTKKAEDYIAQQAQQEDRPFFLYFPLTAPHTPVAPNEAYYNRSKAGKYGDFVTEVDEVIGRVFAAVKKAGIEENTLIVLTSDNGPETIMYDRITQYQHNSSGIFRGAKRDSWEGGSRVPFLVKWPAKIKANTKSDALVSTVDFFATVGDITQSTYPKNAAEDSHSFLASLLQISSDKAERDFVIMHSAGGGFSIREGQWKYIDGKGSHKGNHYKTGANAIKYNAPAAQLYNLAADPGEQNNLYLEQLVIAKRLQKKLHVIQASTRTVD